MLIGLSERELAFLNYLGAGARPCAAVKLAGYRSKGTAANLLRKRHVQAGVFALADHLNAVVARIEKDAA
jgi:hypothetical protein